MRNSYKRLVTIRNPFEDTVRKASPIAFRPNEAQGKMLSELFAYYGLNSESQSDNILSLFEKLYEVTENRKNSQRIGDALADHENNPIDIACNCRITVMQLVKVLDPDNKGKSMWAEKPVSYCVQSKNGKVGRQLKLLSNQTCEICKLLAEVYLREQNQARAEAERAAEAAANSDPILPPVETPQALVTRPAPEPAQEITYTPYPDYKKTIHYIRTDGGFYCPNDGSLVYKYTCINCERHRKKKFDWCCALRREAGLPPHLQDKINDKW